MLTLVAIIGIILISSIVTFSLVTLGKPTNNFDYFVIIALVIMELVTVATCIYAIALN